METTSETSALVEDVGHGHRPPPEGEALLAQRLAVVVLALLTEMEQHSQRHAYWKQHNLAMEGYRIMVAMFKRIGREPESIEEYRRAVGIPDPPTPGDAIIYKTAGGE